MVVQQFREINLRQKSLDLIAKCNAILDEYQAQGLRVTLRQLYYQCVTRTILENTTRNYKNLSTVISDARLAGLMDWDAIEDRGRQPRRNSEWESLADLVESAIYSYRLPRWKGQENYVELWVEKEALSGVLRPIASDFHVTLMVNKGYSSQSAMYESAQRIQATEPENKVIFYLGDHDPSGEDMVRDIEDRLNMFGVENLLVRKVALNMDQVRQYNPPPNPAKITDPRADAYIAKFGDSSWEVDALPPDVLTRLIRASFRSVVDQKLMDGVKEREDFDKAELRKAASKIMKRGA